MNSTLKTIIKNIPYTTYLYSKVTQEIIQTTESLRYRSKKIYDGEIGNRLIYDMIASNSPTAICRFGGSEFQAITPYLQDKKLNPTDKKWSIISLALHRNCGVFPPTADVISRFCNHYLSLLNHIDLLALWFLKGEGKVINTFASQAKLTTFMALNPNFYTPPWTKALFKKRVLVVHPFAKTIESQYKRRESIWPTMPDMLPEFQLQTIKVPLSDYIVKSPFKDWFGCLDFLKEEMSKKDFDVAIIGAGVWSIPLAIHAKRLGRIGIITGGGTQILFGIKGKRWDSNPAYTRYYNEAWCRPAEEETPKECSKIEGGCYW
jgi:hypothetical protein